MISWKRLCCSIYSMLCSSLSCSLSRRLTFLSASASFGLRSSLSTPSRTHPLPGCRRPLSLPCASAASAFSVLQLCSHGYSAGFNLCCQLSLLLSHCFNLSAFGCSVLSVSDSGQLLLFVVGDPLLLPPRSLSLASSLSVVALLLVLCLAALLGYSVQTQFLSPFSHRPSTPN